MAITSIVAVADGSGTVNIDDVQAFTFTPPTRIWHMGSVRDSR
jgi:hypothetical protein